MTVVGAFSFVWKPRRFWPLVLEQHRAFDGPSVIVCNEWPFHWNTPDVPRVPWTDYALVGKRAACSYVNVEKHTGNPDGTKNVINRALELLRICGAEVALWLDDDFVFELDDFKRMVRFLESQPPGWWRCQARHYWRDLLTTYSRGAFRIAMPTSAHWPFEQADELTTQDIPHDIVCHHPSWVGTDEEIEQKVLSWFHAKDGFFQNYMERWRSGTADKEQQLEPIDIEPPERLKAMMR